MPDRPPSKRPNAMEVLHFACVPCVEDEVDAVRPASCFSLMAPALPGTKGPWKPEVVPSAASTAIASSIVFLLQRVVICWEKGRGRISKTAIWYDEVSEEINP